MNLKEERNMILDMVAEGKISVDEAKELLDALEKSARKNDDADAHFVFPGIDFDMRDTSDIFRAANRAKKQAAKAAKRAARHSMQMPSVFYEMDDLAEIRSELEEEIDLLREEMEALKKEASRMNKSNPKIHNEEWGE